MNLRDLTIEQQQILDAVESGDFTSEQVADHLDGISQGIHDKIESSLHALNRLERDLSDIAGEISRLTDLKKSSESNITRMKEWLLLNMADGEKHDYPLFKISKVKGLQVAQINDKTKLGAYITEEIVEKLDKRTLLADLKNGEVDGAEIIIGKSSLRIK